MKHRLALQGLCKRGKASDGDADRFACEYLYQNFRKAAVQQGCAWHDDHQGRAELGL